MSNSYNIYDIDALVIWNVIKANTVCVKVYLLFLTCNMTNPSKKELTNRNRGRPPLWDYSPEHWTPVGSFLHAHCEDYIYSDNFVKYWHLMQKSLIFFWLIIHFFLTITSNFTATLYFSQVSFCRILSPTTQKLPPKLRSSQSGAVRPGSHCSR